MKRAKSTADSKQEVIELDVNDGDNVVDSVSSSQGKPKKRKFTQPDHLLSPADTNDDE